jgi:hypothetical protein
MASVVIEDSTARTVDRRNIEEWIGDISGVAPHAEVTGMFALLCRLTCEVTEFQQISSGITLHTGPTSTSCSPALVRISTQNCLAIRMVRRR